jgi:hypothetical protein
MMVLALALLVPLTLLAASKSILVTLTIRDAITVALDAEVDPEDVKEVLESISSSAISYFTFSFRADAGSSPVVCLAEDAVQAVNEDNAAITVRTFCRRLGNLKDNRYILGAYIPSNGLALAGHYEASATVQALFQ